MYEAMHTGMTMIKKFKEYFDDVDIIFLECFLAHKIESKMTW